MPGRNFLRHQDKMLRFLIGNLVPPQRWTNRGAVDDAAKQTLFRPATCKSFTVVRDSSPP